MQCVKLIITIITILLLIIIIIILIIITIIYSSKVYSSLPKQNLVSG